MIETLNIAQICPETEALGPGKRFVIWVQGCPFNCEGCVAPDWIPQTKANNVTIHELVRRIVDSDKIEGITISGGEPMQQASGLARLLRDVRALRPSLSSIAFSGFTLEQLRKRAFTDPGIAQLLSQLDVLIDGLYMEDLNEGRGLRGSSNQVVHFLTDRYEAARSSFESDPRQIEVHLLTRELLIVGVPPKRALERLESLSRRLEVHH